METLHGFVLGLNEWLWGPPMLVLLVGVHVFLTFRLRFVQRHLWTGIKLSFRRSQEGEGDVSQFGALATALAATIGTGNIVGVATAVALGGPGAVLWCWLTGVFGIATKYAEAVLAVKYRVKTSDGTMLGGPMYALHRGLKARWLALLFCVFTALAGFGIGCMVQANSISSLMKTSLGIPAWATGAFLALLTGSVILGGVRWIAAICERLVPFMAVFYVLGCLVVLAFNYEYLAPAVKLICAHAFTPMAAGGGFAGATVMAAARYGVARGLFSNESGLGSAPIVAAAARTRNPVRQALVSSTGTFWDTVVVCAVSGLVLVSSLIRNPVGLGHLTGADLTQAAFGQVHVVGPVALSVSLLVFVFSTILGWSYYGERACEYLFGKAAIRPYRLLWVLGTFVGAVTKLAFVWDLADAMNALMAIPNLVALLLLSGVVVAETRTYLWSGSLDAEAPAGELAKD
ncbi:MAG: sodium:alanine symporter family protein [Acidobacteriota bacterium]|jgi:AGCS family alanine or glycine:cation symporter|nr:sodium:alanine symporter family protein [Acidobacteriota bacterium]